jgi:hypothetical protein
MFIDESGDHNLDPKKVDKTYPIFVLCGIVFDENYYNHSFKKIFSTFKIKHFGSDDICLHTLEMVRPKKSKDPRFKKFLEPSFRKVFYQDLGAMINESEIKIIACVIKKEDHFMKYNLQALDPYLLSFDNLLNRFVYDLKNGEKGKIIAEKRDDLLDNQLELAWLNVKISGTRKVRPSEIKEKIEDLKLSNKKINEPGLQLADLIASPIGRIVLRKKKRNGNEIDFDFIKVKFRNKNGRILSYGLTIIPS